MSADPTRRRQAAMLRMLAAMTLLTFGGPIGFVPVLKGGARAGWPPDRPVEWVYLIGVSGLILALMALILVVGLRRRPTTERVGADGPKDAA